MPTFQKIAFSMIIICSYYIYFAFPTEHNTVRGVKFICSVYDFSIVNVSCKFKRVNRTTEYWSLNISYAPGVVVDNVHANLTVFARQQNLEWRPHMLINYHIDICKWMDGSLLNKVMDILIDDMKKSNFYNKCPQSGNYYLKNMTFDDKNFPPIVPPADIYLDFQFYTYINQKMRKMYYIRPYMDVKTKGIFYWW